LNSLSEFIVDADVDTICVKVSEDKKRIKVRKAHAREGVVHVPPVKSATKGIHTN
jgi:hypothetical protein